jgi:hypothetical protein
MHLLTPEDFQPWVGRKVRVNTLPNPVELTLSRIETRGRLIKGLDFREPFALYFEAPMDVYLIDHAYDFDCGRGGPHNIYVTQLQPVSNTRIYQAVFN